VTAWCSHRVDHVVVLPDARLPQDGANDWSPTCALDTLRNGTVGAFFA
jgi:hypothetical protein